MVILMYLRVAVLSWRSISHLATMVTVGKVLLQYFLSHDTQMLPISGGIWTGTSVLAVLCTWECTVSSS
jgi:hypothetical protein